MIYEDIVKEHTSMTKPFERCPDHVVKYIGSNKQDEYTLKAGYECGTCGYFILDVVHLNKDYTVQKTRRME